MMKSSLWTWLLLPAFVFIPVVTFGNQFHDFPLMEDNELVKKLNATTSSSDQIEIISERLSDSKTSPKDKISALYLLSEFDIKNSFFLLTHHADLTDKDNYQVSSVVISSYGDAALAPILKRLVETTRPPDVKEGYLIDVLAFIKGKNAAREWIQNQNIPDDQKHVFILGLGIIEDDVVTAYQNKIAKLKANISKTQ